MTEHQRFAAELAQLDREGRPDLALDLIVLVWTGQLSVEDALEAIEAAGTLAHAECSGEVSEEIAGELAKQMARRHQSGVRG